MRDRASTQDLITPCVSLLNRLSLHQVRDDWVDNVWDGQFTESQELPPDYEELIHGVEVGEMFSRLTDLISRWIKTHGSSSGSEDESMNSTSQSLDLYRFIGYQTFYQNFSLFIMIRLVVSFLRYLVKYL